MLVLVANLGSTSFKYRLLDMPAGSEVARGGFERIGQPGEPFPDHAAVIAHVVTTLPKTPDAIGFKAVHGGPISGAVRVTADVIATMERFADVAPAHNPPYIAAMRALAAKLPAVPQVAAFETAFHQTIPAARQTYAIPHEWTESLGIRRYGFHGASHRYIATRLGQLMPKARRVISCHLGGSSSICAILDGKSVANSFGMTAQSGLPHNNRVGDFDAFALLKLIAAGLAPADIFKRLGKEGGLLGISGVSNDLRDIEAAAATGNPRARLAIDTLIESIRHYIGAYLVILGGVDAIIFTGGIGENSSTIRNGVLANLEFVGVRIDPGEPTPRNAETRIDVPASSVAVWVMPTNEELIVARETVAVLSPKQN